MTLAAFLFLIGSAADCPDQIEVGVQVGIAKFIDADGGLDNGFGKRIAESFGEQVAIQANVGARRSAK